MAGLFIDIVKGIALSMAILTLTGCCTYLILTVLDIVGTLYDAFKN